MGSWGVVYVAGSGIILGAASSSVRVILGARTPPLVTPPSLPHHARSTHLAPFSFRIAARHAHPPCRFFGLKHGNSIFFEGGTVGQVGGILGSKQQAVQWRLL